MKPAANSAHLTFNKYTNKMLKAVWFFRFWGIFLALFEILTVDPGNERRERWGETGLKIPHLDLN